MLNPIRELIDEGVIDSKYLNRRTLRAYVIGALKRGVQHCASYPADKERLLHEPQTLSEADVAEMSRRNGIDLCNLVPPSRVKQKFQDRMRTECLLVIYAFSR